MHLWVGLLLGIEILHTSLDRCRIVDSNEASEARHRLLHRQCSRDQGPQGYCHNPFEFLFVCLFD